MLIFFSVKRVTTPKKKVKHYSFYASMFSTFLHVNDIIHTCTVQKNEKFVTLCNINIPLDQIQEP